MSRAPTIVTEARVERDPEGEAPDDCCPDFDWPIGETRTVRWLLNGDALPEDWIPVDHRDSHHSKYSRLIEKSVGRSRSGEGA